MAFPFELSLRNCLQSWFLGSPPSQNLGSPKNVDEKIIFFPPSSCPKFGVSAKRRFYVQGLGF